MGNLESQSRHVIGPLIQDVSIQLDSQKQFTVAKWAIKTAMVGETISRSSRAYFYKREECSQLKESSQFPPYTQVWLGRYVGRHEVGFFGLDSWDKEPKDPTAVVHVYTSTIVLGKLVIQVITIHPPTERNKRPINVRRGRTGPWDHSLLRLLADGGETILWPPALAFSDNGNLLLKTLVERASGTIPTGPIPPSLAG